jgi:pimeloyl-ACP methyl ester carboxylesterase
MNPPRILISYSHDNEQHRNRVLQLADQLRNDGLDVCIDQNHPNPPEGWPLWMERQIEQSDFVLLVFTERYFRRSRGEEDAGTGRGVAWESVLIANELYDIPHVNAKFIPVVFKEDDRRWILPRLRGYTNYCLTALTLEKASDYQSLYRYLTNQPDTPTSELGDIKSLPARPRTAIFSTIDQGPKMVDSTQSPPSSRTKDLAQNAQGHPQKTEHVIALIHGIRDPAHWANVINELESPGVRIVQLRYGYVSALLFLCPLRLTGHLIGHLIRDLRNLNDQFKDAKLSIIAHSFGTYVTLQALKNEPNLNFWKIVFCGSVADDFLNWAEYKYRVGDGIRPTMDFVVNDCATGDVWPVIGAAFGWYYGKAGVLGFSETHVTNRFHRAADGKSAAGHSRCFETDFARKYWRAFLIDDQPLIKGSGVQAEHLGWTKLFFIPAFQWAARILNLLVWLVAVAAIISGFWFGATWIAAQFGNNLKTVTIEIEFDSLPNRNFGLEILYDKTWHSHQVVNGHTELLLDKQIRLIDEIKTNETDLVIRNPGPFTASGNILVTVGTSLITPGDLPSTMLLRDLPIEQEMQKPTNGFKPAEVTFYYHNKSGRSLKLFVLDCTKYYNQRKEGGWDVWDFPANREPEPYGYIEDASTGWYGFVIRDSLDGKDKPIGCFQLLKYRKGILEVTADGPTIRATFGEYKYE